MRVSIFEKSNLISNICLLWDLGFFNDTNYERLKERLVTYFHFPHFFRLKLRCTVVMNDSNSSAQLKRCSSIIQTQSNWLIVLLLILPPLRWPWVTLWPCPLERILGALSVTVSWSKQMLNPTQYDIRAQLRL